MMKEDETTMLRKSSDKPLLRALNGETLASSPWWLMRQAGRYLPEYRAARTQARDFIELCFTPPLAAEVTLQPVRRFGMDAAILFSDILLLPHALGQKLEFREGEGPVLEAVSDVAGLIRLNPDPARVLAGLSPVLETVERVSAALDQQTALIGFAGAPWTVAAYMVEGGGSRDFMRAKSWAYRDPTGFAVLIDILTEATIAFLSAQISAGAEVVQLFDSWAGMLPAAVFARWVIEPTRRIVAALRREYPEVPIIGFPRGAGLLYPSYVAETGVSAIGLDTSVPIDEARSKLQPEVPVQGNLDPVLLLVGGDALAVAVRGLHRDLCDGPYVFNLGHGVLPETPPEHVAMLPRLLAEARVAHQN